MRLLPGGRLWLDKKKHVTVCGWSESVVLLFSIYLELVTLRLSSWISASYGRCWSEISNKSWKFVSYFMKSSMKQHVQVTEVMLAWNLLYVYARMYQTIHACRPVSVRVLRTAVREWACCKPSGIPNNHFLHMRRLDYITVWTQRNHS